MQPAPCQFCWKDPIVWLTAGYVLVSLLLWLSTRKAALAAAKSADAASKSVEVLETLNRPYLGISELRLTNDCTTRHWVIGWTAKNFGTLPTPSVTIDFAFFQGGLPFDSQRDVEAFELFPEHERTERFDLWLNPGELHQGIIEGRTELLVRVQVHYTAGRLGTFRHQATFAFSHEQRNFVLSRSSTVTVAAPATAEKTK